LHKYASDGLRTLLVGKREISKEEFEGWNKKYEVKFYKNFLPKNIGSIVSIRK